MDEGAFDVRTEIVICCSRSFPFVVETSTQPGLSTCGRRRELIWLQGTHHHVLQQECKATQKVVTAFIQFVSESETQIDA